MLKSKTLLIVLAAVIIGAVYVAGTFYYKAREGKRVQNLAQADAALLVRPYAPQWGPADAKVTITEFLDPECESCRAAYPLVKGLLKKYPEQVKLVVRYLPLHQNSEFAIKALEAARKQGKYWEALDIVFRHQPEWGDHHNPRPEIILQVLPRIFVDIEKLKVDMLDPEIAFNLQQDIADANKLGARGTPTFFVNGKQAGLYELESAIEAALKK